MNKTVKINRQIIPILYSDIFMSNNNSWGWGYALVVLGFWLNDILTWDTLGRINENNTGTFKTKKKRKFNNILDLPPHPFPR